MALAKKFGTFGGVFTPSILTILGVIMYLRLGWVVGEAGFYAALGLILLAHVISISTGLSLSSIATDKKIKTGGIYYMLSRSLGFPMGGSIGITLFLGTALSIALYIVGFVESFLSIEVISQFLGMDGSVNDIRIIGTFVIIILVILAYISTSIAIKTQYLILGAIALSLVSIVVGVFMNTDVQSSGAALMPMDNAPDLIVIFAVFFPAVTGFTAGVAMSGDLKSPKESIPKGTLMAIGVGLVVYVGLAYLFAFYVDRDLLLSDTNFLQKIAWISPLVVAGIWGATLSSALGGILGGPRILQAMSSDKVTHPFFAKGVGDSNEPRRALILTFLLAEMGILIGQLDIIAGIVSMFYIAAYGFINLAYVLERWANSDFRPSMKISIWVGIIGFVASIGVMLKLDTLGMVVAFGIMFGIYAYLKRREVQGNMTDVWQSVWTSIIRASLDRINKKPLKENNWQSNIILFSGGGKARPHLLELGINIAGKQGFLSNFDLIINDKSEFLFPRSKQKIHAEIDEQNTGVFTRQQSVKNLYDGIEMIAQTYGFSGVEPNTVMMGWARQSADPIRFSKLVYNLSSLDMNVILLDYDKKRGWGKKETIDIWWRGGSNNGNLALSLAKFITNSDDWAMANIRLLIVNPHNNLSASIYENASRVLESLRINADLRIINNEIEQRSFYEIIEVESLNTDLTFLGFPMIKKGREIEFVEETNKLCKDIGTVAIIQASSDFKDLSLGNIKPQTQEDDELTVDIKSIPKTISVSLDKVERPALSKYIETISGDLDQLSSKLFTELISPIFEKQNKWLEKIQESGIKSFDNLLSRAPNNQAATFRKLIAGQHQMFLRSQLQLIENEGIADIGDLLAAFQSNVLTEVKAFVKGVKKAPYRVKVKLSKEDWKNALEGEKKMRKHAGYLRPLFLFRNEIPYYIHMREFLLQHYPQSLYQMMYLLIGMLNKDGYQFENEVYKTMQKISGVFSQTSQLNTDKLVSEEDLKAAQTEVSALIQTLIDKRKAAMAQMLQKLYQLLVVDMNHVVSLLNDPLPNAHINYSVDRYSLVKKKRKQFLKSIVIWKNNKELEEHVDQLNTLLLGFRYSSHSIMMNLNTKVQDSINDTLGKPIKEINEVLKIAGTKDAGEQKAFVTARLKNFQSSIDIRIQQIFIDQYNYGLKRIKTSISQFPEQLKVYTDSQMFTGDLNELKPLESIDVAIKRTVDFIVERELMEIREMIINVGREMSMMKTKLNEILQTLLISTSVEETSDAEYKELSDSNLEYGEMIEASVRKLQDLEESLIEKANLLSGVLIKKTDGLKANLELYPFIRSIQDLKQYIKIAQTERWFSQLTQYTKTMNQWLSHQMNNLWYNQSSGLLLAKKLSKAVLEHETRVETLLNFKDTVSPSAKVMKKMPDYYKQLFLRKQFYLNEFWVGRDEEINAFYSGLEKWKLGHSGGIMILGERNSGKSFFANYIDQLIEVEGDSFYINPPYTGSVVVSDLLQSFQTVTETQGSFAKIFNEIPADSVFFIDDLELWWEKSSRGMQVIDELVNIINKFGKKHLFVVLGNIHTFSLLNKYKRIESVFLSLIELRPFNARQLKEIVMRRHTSSAMSFVMNNTPQSRYRSWNYARLFSRFFSYSEGSPGVALQAWMKSIEEVDKSSILMKTPKNPDITALRYIETEWMIFIMHFLLHKRMNLAKLIRVSQMSRMEVIKRVRILQRAGVLLEIGDDILDINRYMLPFLRKALVKRELL